MKNTSLMARTRWIAGALAVATALPLAAGGAAIAAYAQPEPTAASTNDPVETPPTARASLPAADWGDWYRWETDVELIGTAGSTGAVTEIDWTMSGATTGSGVITGSSGTVPVTGNGTTTITFYAVDLDGFASDTETVDVNLDLELPGGPSINVPASGTIYTVGDTVTVDVGCADAESGIAECSITAPDGTVYRNGDSLTFTEAGFPLSYEAYVRDNVHPGTIYTFHVFVEEAPEPDTTAPVVTVAPSIPVPSSGWITDSSTLLGVTAADAVGTTSIEYRRAVQGGGWTSWAVAAASGSTSFALPTSGEHGFQFRASDAAGNVSQVVEYLAKADYEISGASISGFPGAFDLDEEYELVYGCSDAVSGVATCASSNGPSGTLLPTDVPGTHSFTLTNTDVAGNSKTTTWTYDVVAPDTTAPVVAARVGGAPASSAWFHDSTTFEVRATDDASGVARVWVEATGAEELTGQFIDGASFEYTVEAEGETVFTTWAEDEDGNASVPQLVTVRIDRGMPTITIVEPEVRPALVTTVNSYSQGATVALRVDCADGLSGIRSCTFPATLPTNVAGSRSVTVVATDAAGNRTAQTINYTVTAADATPAVLASTGSEPWLLLPLVVGLVFAGLVIVTLRGRMSR